LSPGVAPGTGKTKTLAVEVLRTLYRGTSTVDGSLVGQTKQRILCVTSTNSAARNICDAISKYLGSDTVGLIVSAEYQTQAGMGDAYAGLLSRGFILTEHPHTKRWHTNSGTDGNKQYGEEMNPEVLVMTMSMAMNHITRPLLQSRQTVILDGNRHRTHTRT
jgi:hypothetical protein